MLSSSPLTRKSLGLWPRSPPSPRQEGLSSLRLPTHCPSPTGGRLSFPGSGRCESPQQWCLLQYKVLLYSLDGRLLSAYCAYEWSLGVKSVAWSPSSQFLAVGSYDGKVRTEQRMR